MTEHPVLRLALVAALAAGAAVLPSAAEEPPAIDRWARQMMDSLPPEARPQIIDGQLQMPPEGSWTAFGERMLAAARQYAAGAQEGQEIRGAGGGAGAGGGGLAVNQCDLNARIRIEGEKGRPGRPGNGGGG